MRKIIGPLIMAVLLVGLGVVVGTMLGGETNRSQEGMAPQIITVPVLITATTDPNATAQVRVITATPPAGSIGMLPTGLVDGEAAASGGLSTPPPTIDPELLGADAALRETVTALPDNCIMHTVVSGDTPFGIAEIYGANGFDLMAVNGFSEARASNLRIGEVLIVPLEGCSLTAADLAPTSSPSSASNAEGDEDAEATEEADAEPSNSSASARPTVTLPPTATSAQVQIVEVFNAGDITAERVEIRNTGGIVNLSGWTLENSEGETFTFPEQRLYTNGIVSVHSRPGTNTPIAIYWGLSDAVWGKPGETITLKDANGAVQASLRLETPRDLP